MHASARRIRAVVARCAATVASVAAVATGAPAQEPAFFVTADRCIACHSNLSAASGEDVSIGYSWRSSMMANSARDPYWHAAVRREVMDHPQAQAAIEDKCSTCHMPMARYVAAAAGGQGPVFAHLDWKGDPGEDDLLARDGVSCSVCHQIQPHNFGRPESFTGAFLIDTTRPAGARTAYGPFVIDSGRQRLMQSAARFVPSEGSHLQESELCATCHTLYTHALDAAGNEVGQLPEQVPFLEWKHSAYRESRSCQSCHMPQLPDSTLISSVLGEPRAGFSRHVFRGGNAFMLGILNKYRDQLNVAALPQELDATVRRTVAFLQESTARVSIDYVRASDTRLELNVEVDNRAGHKLPTAYPSRRAWLHLLVRDASGHLVFESGALRPDGSIVGNDNDSDPTRYEPHYGTIQRGDQVQIYEPVMVDAEGRVTTGLLFGVRYVKDNRLLPRGFDKASAEADVAVRGGAREDVDFVGGGDRVRYAIGVPPTGGRLMVTAELWYQSIGYRWAHNLEAYRAPEIDRFVGYYEATAASSATRIAADTVTVEP